MPKAPPVSKSGPLRSLIKRQLEHSPFLDFDHVKRNRQAAHAGAKKLT